jgi:hypothetical protein
MRHCSVGTEEASASCACIACGRCSTPGKAPFESTIQCWRLQRVPSRAWLDSTTRRACPLSRAAYSLTAWQIALEQAPAPSGSASTQNPACPARPWGRSTLRLAIHLCLWLQSSPCSRSCSATYRGRPQHIPTISPGSPSLRAHAAPPARTGHSSARRSQWRANGCAVSILTLRPF